MRRHYQSSCRLFCEGNKGPIGRKLYEGTGRKGSNLVEKYMTTGLCTLGGGGGGEDSPPTTGLSHLVGIEGRTLTQIRWKMFLSLS
jgi:hypothetical protein